MKARRTIWKFPVPLADDPFARVEGARVVRWLGVASNVAGPGAALLAWAEVELDPNTVTTYRLHIRGTGHPLNRREGWHLGSVIQRLPLVITTDPPTQPAPLVWHVFADVDEFPPIPEPIRLDDRRRTA